MLKDGRELSTRTYTKNDQFLEESKCCISFQQPDDTRLLCCRCVHKRKTSPFTCIAICFLVLTYNLLGGFLFLAIEGNAAEETTVAASKLNLSEVEERSIDLRSKTVERLWSITEDLNILYKENWTKLAAKELMDFQKVLIKNMKGEVSSENEVRFKHEGDYRWTFSSSFLYALTLITTIGHGNVAPKTSVGKTVAIAYACIGIPIIMLYLATLGETLARNFRIFYSKVCPSRFKSDNFHAKADCLNRLALAGCEKQDYSTERENRTPFQAALNLNSFNDGYHWTCRDHTRVPILLSLLLIVLYVALGSLIFTRTEKWTIMDGCYFSFSSLATIGFGNLRPGLHASSVSTKTEDLALGVCCIYILVGIIVIATCFNLIQEDMSIVLRSFTVLCTGGPKSRAVHSAEKIYDDKLSMSVVS